MGKVRGRLAGALVVGLSMCGMVAISAPGAANAAGCTVTLTDQTSYTGTGAPETVCVAGSGDYTVDTAGGDDIVRVVAAAKSVHAILGEGNDAYLGPLARTSTVDAGAGADKVMTGSGDDTVSGGDDSDRIVTKDGADTIFANGGDDNVNAGNGSDVVDGGPGFDRISGLAGDDDLAGGEGPDKVNGGTGNDTLSGGPGDDAVAGSDGIDAVSGGNGTDKLSGGNGDDGFDGTGLDTASAGSGDAACSNEATLSLTCARGAVVVSVDHTVEPTVSGWKITVRARALDFEGVGVTRIKIAQNPMDLGIGLAPTLVEGTPQNGVYEAVFNVTEAPASGHFGVRVFTNGFSIDRWVLNGLSYDMSVMPMNSWPCITNLTTDTDVDCGQFSGVGSILAGFPKAMRSIEIPGPSTSDLTWTLVADTTANYQIGPSAPYYHTVLGYNTGVVYVPKQTGGTDTSVVDYSFSTNQSGSIGGRTSLPCTNGTGHGFPWEQSSYTARAYVVTGNASVPGGQSWFMTTLPKKVLNRC